MRAGPQKLSKRPERGRRAWHSGHAAERLAALYLMAKGYRILEKRFRTPVGEIDLIVRRGRVIAYVEVKQRPEEALALEAVSETARRRISQAAAWYGARLKEPDLTQRFDVIAVRPWRLPRHLENAWTV